MRTDSSTLARSACSASSTRPSSADACAWATSSSTAIAGMSSCLATSAPSRNAASAPGTSPTARRAWPRTRRSVTAASDGAVSADNVDSARAMARSGSPDTYSAVASVATAAPATLLPSNGQRSIVWRPTITTSSARPWCTTAHMRGAQPPGTLRVGVVTVAPAQRLGEVVVRTHHLAHELRAPRGGRAAQGLASALQRLIGEAVEGGVASTALPRAGPARTAARSRARGTASTGRTCRRPPARRARARRPGRRSAGRRRRSPPAGGRRCASNGPANTARCSSSSRSSGPRRS